MDNWDEVVTIDAEIQGGAPVIRGTRVPVSILVEAVAAGDTVDEVAQQYRVTTDQVRAALAYAAELIKGERTIALPR